MVNIIDLKFQGISKAIASFLIESEEGPVLIETGPHSTFKNLQSAVSDLGYQIEDIKHVLLSHIHFDHAGAAWALAQHGAKIYLHPFGVKHMADPSRLYESAKRIYQDKMDTLWGKLEPIAQDRLIQMSHEEVLEIGNLKFVAHHTPGHAVHHIAWQLDDILFTGDVAGVKVQSGPVMPPCPPPDINIEDWQKSMNLIRGLDINKMYLTHFGVITEIDQHLDELENCLTDWADWMKAKWEQGLTHQEITPQFQAYVNSQLMDAGLTKEEIDRYEAANPAWMSVAGLIRYWVKKKEGKKD